MSLFVRRERLLYTYMQLSPIRQDKPNSAPTLKFPRLIQFLEAKEVFEEVAGFRLTTFGYRDLNVIQPFYHSFS